MWILFRIVIGLTAFVVRQLHRARKPVSQGIENGRARYLQLHKHKGAITGFSVGVALTAPLAFSISKETARDRFFKRLGLSAEMETGDRAFDDFVYLMCDHPILGQLLTRSAEARAAIRALLEDGFTRLRYDGHALWADKRVAREPSDDEERGIGALAEALAPLEREQSGRFSDPFLWRAVVVEGVVWSFAGYAAASLISTIGQSEDIHLDHGALVLRGTLLAGLMFAALVALTIALLRGSSRGHRVIFESAIVLVIALPPSGWQAYADLNRGLDRTRLEVTVPITSCETRVTRTKRGTRTSHHLHLGAASTDGVHFPATLQTSAGMCHVVTPGGKARAIVGKGALGLPWLRELSVNGYSWTS